MNNSRSVWKRSLLCLLALLMVVSFAACKKPTPPDQGGSDPIPDPTPVDGRYNPHAEARAEGADSITLREYSRVEGTLVDPDSSGSAAGLQEYINTYMTEYDAVKMDGTVSTFQISKLYGESLQLNTEAMMAYVGSAEGVDRMLESWATPEGFYELNIMTAVNRGDSDYLDRDPANKGDIQTRADGGYITNSGGSYYMVPTEQWVDYVWETVEYILENYTVASITFEEPEMWQAAGYSEGFKKEWEAYYGEAWVPQTDSPQAQLKTVRLKAYLFDRMIATIADRMAEIAPDTKLYVASHSTVSYTGIGVTAGLDTYIASGNVDGVIGQTWSNTASQHMMIDGQSSVIEFVNAYLGYASYAGVAGDLDLYAITDPMADPLSATSSWTEEECFPKYKATLISALLQPEINRFEAAVWPDRCFTAVSAEYRTLQLACYEAINEMSGKAVTVSAGTPGITYLLSDSLSYQNGSASWSLSSRDGYYGVTAPLTLDGIPLKIRSLEQIEKASDLEGVTLLILSWDCQKPLNEDCVDAIADWIKAGGTALYVGGHDQYAESEDEWWSYSGSPLQTLFDKLDLDITVTHPTLSSSTLSWLGGSSYDTIADLSLASTYANFYTGFEGADAKAILKAGDTVLGIDQTAGKGHIVAIGLPSALFAQTQGGTDAMQDLTAYVCNSYGEYEYQSTTLMWAKRGRIIAAHSYEDGNVLTGKFINLFDPELKVVDYVVINEGEDVLLCDVSDTDLSTPTILYSGGAHAYEPLETADRTLFRIIGPLNTQVATRVACADGKYPVSVKATDGEGNQVRVSSSWDNATDTLLIMVDGRTDGTQVEILWGDTPMADTKLPIRELFSVATNNENLDAAWIVRATAGANGGLRYADKTTEVVYKIDLTPFTNPTIALHIFQNYLISYSYDDVEWTVLADYSTTDGYNGTLTTGGNNTVVQLDGSILNGHDAIYIRIADCNPEDGWGGSITKIEVSYLREEDEEPFALPAPEKPEEPEEPVVDVSAFEPIGRDFAAEYADRDKFTFIVNQNSDEDDPFIVKDTSAANASYKYTDANKELIYRFDLSEYSDAVVVATVAQNYYIQVSADGKRWVTIQDYALVNGSRISGAGNQTVVGVAAEKYAPDSEYLYLRFANADTSAGWGSAIYRIDIYCE